MNIFFLDTNIAKSCSYYMDTHVNSTVKEICQMLSTTQRLNKTLNASACMQITHHTHPMTKWICYSQQNYKHAFQYFVHLLEEFKYRRGKTHECLSYVKYLITPPPQLAKYSYPHPPQCMPDYCKFPVDQYVSAYRFYYALEKSHLEGWTKRQIPIWYTELRCQIKEALKA